MINIHHKHSTSDSSPMRKSTPLLERAIRCHENGNAEDARILYQRVLKNAPDHPDALHLMGVLEHETGHHEKAILLISKAILFAPMQPVFYSNLGNAFLDAGQIQKAISCYQKSLALNPDFHNAYYNLAVAYRQSNLFEDSEAVIKKILKRNQQWSDGWHLLGSIHHQNGRIKESIDCFEKALEINPNLEQAWFFIGNAFRLKKDYPKAESCYRRALAIKPDFVECLNNLGICCFKTDKLLEAVDCYESALRDQPDFAEAHYNSGNALFALERYEEAITHYQNAINFKSGFFDSMVGLGKSYHRYGEYGRAMKWYRKALFIKPTNWQVLEQAGNVRRLVGDVEGAFKYFQKALKIKPDAHSVYNSIGNTYKYIDKKSKAVSAYRNALQYNPEFLPALNNLAIVLSEIDETEKAISMLNTVLDINDTFSTRVKREMIFPIIYESTDEILDVRQKFMDKLDDLLHSGGVLNDPYREIGFSNFILALHGLNEKEIRIKIANFYINVCKDLQWTSPYLKSKLRGAIKIGFISRYLYQHTIGRLFQGLIENLDKQKFEITIFRYTQAQDDVGYSIDKSASNVVILPNDFRLARRKIAEKELDILFYPEIGMDAFTYFLAFSRLAPVQCKKGFPVTTGIPTIDYFVSSEYTEPPNAEKNYSENLIRLKTLGYYLYKPQNPREKFSPDQFGIPSGKKRYACLQSLFKLHPDFDVFIDRIFKRDPDAILLLLDGQYKEWNEKIIKRLEKKEPDVRRKIHFLPRQAREEFVALFLLADAVIDSIYFSGGHTSLECFALGIPVVTWPSNQMAGRLTYGYYKRMGIMDCIAKDADEYADIAFRLAHDCSWRENIGRKIKKRSSILFENLDDVRDLEQFLENAVQTAYSKK
jgi:predicted O-linked N-acetylglucosamine transferase (SPINDLY family)